MNYKNLFHLVLIIFVSNCTIDSNISNKLKHKIDQKFINKGFALIYDDQLVKDKVVSKIIDDRSLLIFQRNLKKNSSVKLTNLSNNKTVLAKVGANSLYPNFYNSVISKRIAKELELKKDNPYIEILLISENSSFVAKKVKMFKEEKKVAAKAPIDGIKISDLNNTNKKVTKIKEDKFYYYIKIADFYYKDSANNMIKRIKKETNIKNINIRKLSKTNYRVFLGPFDDIILLQDYFNKISILEFENLEIIKND